jgi:putative sterol carrier protein
LGGAFSDDAPGPADEHHILSFRTMFDAEAAGGVKANIELRFGDARFQAAIANGEMTLVAGSVEEPDAVVESDPNALAAVVYGGRKLTEALRAGDIKVSGDKSLVRRFVTLFPLPERAAVTS